MDKAISLDAKTSSLCKYERASILLATERFHEALIELEDLKKLLPKESPVYFLLGKVRISIFFLQCSLVLTNGPVKCDEHCIVRLHENTPHNTVSAGFNGPVGTGCNLC